MGLAARATGRAAIGLCASWSLAWLTGCEGTFGESPPHTAPANPTAEGSDGRVELSWDAVADLAPRAPRPTPGERLLALRNDPAARVVLDRVPHALRNPVRRLGVPRLAEEPPQDAPRTPALETSILQACDYRFPTAKARRMLGFEPPVAFDEACRRTVAWLGFAGYPLAAAARSPAR